MGGAPCEAVEQVIRGDACALGLLSGWRHEDLQTICRDIVFVVSPNSPARVLRELRDGLVSGSQAREWAFFLQHGHLVSVNPSPQRPIQPLSIDYDAAAEDAIVEVLARLEQIGDLIDGDPPTVEDIEKLLSDLCASK